MKVYCKTTTGITHEVDYELVGDMSKFCSEIHAALLKKGVPRDELPNLMMSSTPFSPETSHPQEFAEAQIENPPVPEPEKVDSSLPGKSEYRMISDTPWDPAYVHVSHPSHAWFKFSDARWKERHPPFPDTSWHFDPKLPSEEDEKKLRLCWSRYWLKLNQVTLDPGHEFDQKIGYRHGWSKETTVQVSPSLGLSAKGFTAGINATFSHKFSEFEETSVERQFSHPAPEKNERAVCAIWQLVDVIQSLQPGQEVGVVKTNTGILSAGFITPTRMPYTWGFLIECPLNEFQVRGTKFPI